MIDLYSCVGYVHDRNRSTNVECDICFIYDVTTPPVTVSPSNNRVSGMPEISKEIGEILHL